MISYRSLCCIAMPTSPIWPCVDFGLVHPCEDRGAGKHIRGSQQLTYDNSA